MLDLASDPSIESIYHVCGTHPWLYIQAQDAAAPLAPTLYPQRHVDLRNIRPGFTCWSHTSTEPGEPLATTDARLQNFIFLRRFLDASPALPSLRDAPVAAYVEEATLQEAQDRLSEIAEAKHHHAQVRRCLRLDASEWWFVLEVLVPSTAHLSDLLEEFTASGFDTSTKCVLVRWKDRNQWEQYFTDNFRRKDAFPETPRPDPNFKIATIVRNDRAFFRRPFPEQCRILEAQLRSGLMPKERVPYAPIPEQLAYPPHGTTVWGDQLKHPNRYVSHFTLRPISNLWEFALAFVRGAREKRPDLSRRLSGLVGVDSTLIIPRVYRITGEYDFVIPAYTIGDEGIQELIRRISDLPVDGNPSIIRCRIPESDPATEHNPLSEAACKMVKALFRNSADSEALTKELSKVQAEWAARRRDGAANRVRDTLSPRAFSVDFGAWKEDGEPDDIPRRPSTVGLALTWELDPKEVQHAIVRLTPRSLLGLADLETQVRKFVRQDDVGRHEIAFDYFVSERKEVVGIARFIEREELERFLVNVRKTCDRTEFHVILNQLASISSLSKDEACRPCVAPSDERLEIAPGDCSQCGRYLRAPGPALLKVRIDERSDRKRPRLPDLMRVGLLDLAFSFESLRDLGFAADHDDAVRIDEAYERDLCELVTDGELGGADVVVLPEYCVPRRVAQAIVKRVAKKECSSQRVLVLGSHLDRWGFNTSPVACVSARGVRVFLQQKRHLSRMEQGLVTRMGSGSYLFRTDLGNVLVAVCLDAFQTNPLWVADVDIVAVPSFHWGVEENLVEHITRGQMFRHRIVVFANGAESDKPEHRTRVVSCIRAGERQLVDASQTGRRVMVGGHTGTVLTLEVEPKRLDGDRAKEAMGKPAEGIIPIHVDLWRDERPELLGGVAERLKQLEGLIRFAPGKQRLEHYLTLDWEEAYRVWRHGW